MLIRISHPVWPAWASRCIALFLLVSLSIPMLLIALAIWMHFGRPILFKQTRTGLQGELFTLYKFRTMHESKTSSGEYLDDVQRLDRFGRCCRQWSVDELPQLWNIVRGDLNFIGPRPLLPEYLPHYTPEQMRRHLVKPGITGWAQVNGRNALSWPEKFALDVWYVDHQSLWLDAKILWLTLKHLIRPQNVSQPGQATSEKFKN